MTSSSTPLVTAAQAVRAVGITQADLSRYVRGGHLAPVACAVRGRALLYPLAAVFRAEMVTSRRTRMRHEFVERLRHAPSPRRAS